MIGTRIAHYEITAKIGEGGTCEVWRATDTRLHRDVAIKVLPQDFTEDRERLARFRREANVLAQLQHPNVASIYGLEESGSTHALVMELVDGPTLAERMERGPMTVDESLSIARKIAGALEEAHEKGIVHRDLKPQNIKASLRGTVKVLDFGLAKALDPTGSGARAMTASELARSPTVTANATAQGILLGTAAYMAPEQARGNAVDKRADIWAFGVVLFEMLTGRPLFVGDSVADTLAQVLHHEVDFDALPSAVPPAIRRLLRRCLERDLTCRLRDIGDARLVLDEARGGTLEEPVPTGTIATGTPRWVAPTIVAALAAGAVGAAVVLRATAPAPRPEPVVRFDIPQPSDLPYVGAPKLSPDGRHIAYVARDEKGVRLVWVRSLDSVEARPLPGTEGIPVQVRPFWSPDSRWLGFFLSSQLMKVPIEGGRPQEIAAHSGADGSWGEDGTILFDEPIFSVPASGGVPRTVVPTPEDGHGPGWPHFLPGGDTFLYLVYRSGDEQNGIWIARADGSDQRRLIPGDLSRVSRAEYAPPGWLLYVRGNTLVAQRFDIDRRAIVGEPITLANGIGVSGNGFAPFSVSRDGVLAYRAISDSRAELASLDLLGRLENAPLVTGNFLSHPAFSPDGRWLAYDVRVDAEHRAIRLHDLKRGVSSLFTSPGQGEAVPLFSPDGQRLYFARVKPGNAGVDVVSRPLAGGDETVVVSGDGDFFPSSISPDGRWLVVAVNRGSQWSDLAAVDLERGGEPMPLTSTPEFNEIRSSLSPDGHWLAMERNRFMVNQILVQSFPGPGRTWQVSKAGGTDPIWSPDGNSIFFLDDDNFLNRVSVKAGSSFDAGEPERLFRLNLFVGLRRLALSPDGKRLVAVLQAGSQEPPPTTVVVGWDTELPQP